MAYGEWLARVQPFKVQRCKSKRRDGTLRIAARGKGANGLWLVACGTWQKERMWQMARGNRLDSVPIVQNVQPLRSVQVVNTGIGSTVQSFKSSRMKRRRARMAYGEWLMARSAWRVVRD